MFAPAVDYDKDQIDQAIRAVEKKFPDDIERIAYSVGDDWADEPALFSGYSVKDRGGSPSDLRQSSRLPEVLSISRAVMADLGDAVRCLPKYSQLCVPVGVGTGTSPRSPLELTEWDTQRISWTQPARFSPLCRPPMPPFAGRYPPRITPCFTS